MSFVMWLNQRDLANIERDMVFYMLQSSAVDFHIPYQDV